MHDTRDGIYSTHRDLKRSPACTQVTNLSKINAVPIEGVAQAMQIQIGDKAYLSVAENYGYSTDVENGFTGTMQFDRWGNFAGPGASFTIQFTLACDKVGRSLGRVGVCLCDVKWQRR